MKKRKIPLRKCVGCQEMKSKKELIRIVKTPDDEVMIDLTGKKSGRGAYLCGKRSCFQLAHKHRSLDKALKHKVSSDIYEQLEQEFIKVEDDFLAAKVKGQEHE